jgi:hypothetical protein
VLFRVVLVLADSILSFASLLVGFAVFATFFIRFEANLSEY